MEAEMPKLLAAPKDAEPSKESGEAPNRLETPMILVGPAYFPPGTPYDPTDDDFVELWIEELC